MSVEPGTAMLNAVVTSLHPTDRPRERLFLHGPAALRDVELVALVLGGGRSLSRAVMVLQQLGGLRALRSATPLELLRGDGLGEAGASALCAAFELGRRAAQLELPLGTPLRTPSDVGAYVRARMGDAPSERFMILGLDARQRVRLVETVAIGSLSSVEVHPREVFRPLVRGGLHSVIAVHNHPSGDPSPSEADIELTRRLAEVGLLVGIPLLDHLVVTRSESVSMATLGLLP
ncbi:MAG: DNA repair protein RadC [Nannocystaceae bacterium]|nr:DNA repair protein RadC [Nannocystaceae bacterium]